MTDFTDLSYRSSYSAAQVDKYYERIRLPEKYRPNGKAPGEQLSSLAEVMKHHLAAIPFGNLELHYFPAKQFPLSPNPCSKRRF